MMQVVIVVVVVVASVVSLHPPARKQSRVGAQSLERFWFGFVAVLWYHFPNLWYRIRVEA